MGSRWLPSSATGGWDGWDGTIGVSSGWTICPVGAQMNGVAVEGTPGSVGGGDTSSAAALCAPVMDKRRSKPSANGTGSARRAVEMPLSYSGGGIVFSSLVKSWWSEGVTQVCGVILAITVTQLASPRSRAGLGRVPVYYLLSKKIILTARPLLIQPIGTLCRYLFYP